MKRWIWLWVLPWSISVSSINFTQDGELPISKIEYKGRAMQGMSCLVQGSFCDWQSDFIDAMNAAYESRNPEPLGIRVKPDPKGWCEAQANCQWNGSWCICTNYVEEKSDDVGAGLVPEEIK